MLEELAKKDKRWREVALNICKSKDLADEIVNQMYLRVVDERPDKEKLTEWYIITIIRNLFLDHCKQRKHISIETLYYLPDDQTDKTFNDEEINMLQRINTGLKWWEKQLLIESYDKSLRDIEKEFNINYMFVKRRTEKARHHILGDDYKPNKVEGHSNIAKSKEDKRTKAYKNGKRTA